MPAQRNSQRTLTSLGQGCMHMMIRCNLPPALLAEWPGSFTCHSSKTGVERTSKKSRHTKLTLERKILWPLLPGFKLSMFWSRVQSSTNKPSHLHDWPFSNPLPCCMWSHILHLKVDLVALIACQDSLLVTAPHAWSKGCELKSWQRQQENSLLQSYLCVLTYSVSVPSPCYHSGT